MMKNGGKAATIVDVAREAGVSYATVSRVVNNKDHVIETSVVVCAVAFSDDDLLVTQPS